MSHQVTLRPEEPEESEHYLKLTVGEEGVNLFTGSKAFGCDNSIYMNRREALRVAAEILAAWPLDALSQV